MSHYYYFAATLPNLQLGSEAPLSSGEFLERAGRALPARDTEALKAAVLVSGPEGEPEACRGVSPFLDGYYSWERAFRASLARGRAARLGRASAPPEGARAPGPAGRAADTSQVEAQTRAVLGAADPLEGELAVERERWAVIGSLLNYDIFSFEALAAYRLRLQSLERLASFEAGRGERGYRGVYEAILGATSAIDLTGDLR